MTIKEKIQSLTIPGWSHYRDQIDNAILNSKDVESLIERVALFSYNKGYEEGCADADSAAPAMGVPEVRTAPSLNDDFDELENAYGVKEE